MHICIYTLTYIHIYVYIHIYMYTYICTYMHMCVVTHECTRQADRAYRQTSVTYHVRRASSYTAHASAASAASARGSAPIYYVCIMFSLHWYGVVSISRLLKIIGLFCTRAL